MSKRITVVLEYEDDMAIPAFGANMVVQIAGFYGKLVAVAFEDVLVEREKEEGRYS